MAYIPRSAKVVKTDSAKRTSNKTVATDRAKNTPSKTVATDSPKPPAKPPASAAKPPPASPPASQIVQPFLTPAQQYTLGRYNTNYGLQISRLERAVTDATADTGLKESQNVHEHAVGTDNENQVMAARGLFQSSIRDGALNDLDATLAMRNNLLQTNLQRLTLDNNAASGRLTSDWVATHNYYNSLAVGNAAAIPTQPPSPVPPVPKPGTPKPITPKVTTNHAARNQVVATDAPANAARNQVVATDRVRNPRTPGAPNAPSGGSGGSYVGVPG